MILLLACATEGEDTAVTVEDVTVEDATCEHDPALDWDNFAEGFFQRYCTSCHSANLADGQRSGAPLGVDFDSEQEAWSWAPVLAAYVLGSGASMPPGGGPTVDELQMFAEWLGCGE